MARVVLVVKGLRYKGFTDNRRWVSVLRGNPGEEDMANIFFKNQAFGLSPYQKSSYLLGNTTGIPLVVTPYQETAGASGVVNEQIDFANGDESAYTFEDVGTAGGAANVTTLGKTVTLMSGSLDSKVLMGCKVVINGTAAAIVSILSSSSFSVNVDLGTIVAPGVTWTCKGLKLVAGTLSLKDATAFYMPSEWSALFHADGSPATPDLLPVDASAYGDAAHGMTTNWVPADAQTKMHYRSLAPDGITPVYKFGTAAFDFRGNPTPSYPVPDTSTIDITKTVTSSPGGQGGDRFHILNSDFMVDFWCRSGYKTSGASEALSGTFFSVKDGSSTYYWNLSVNSTGAEFRATAGIGAIVLSGITLADTYSHVMFAKKGLVFGIFVNGVLRKKADVTEVAVTPTSPVTLRFGRRYTGDDIATGLYDELRVVKGQCDYNINAYSEGDSVFTPPSSAYAGSNLVPINTYYYVETEAISTSTFWTQIDGFAITESPTPTPGDTTAKIAVNFNGTYKVYNEGTSSWDVLAGGLADIATSGMSVATVNALGSKIMNTGGFVPGTAGTLAFGLAIRTTSDVTAYYIDKISVTYSTTASKKVDYSGLTIETKSDYSVIEITNTTGTAKNGNLVVK